MREWVHQLTSLNSDKIDHIVVTLASVKGSAPQVVGAKMIITENELFGGTIGGGKIEAHSINFAKEMLKQKREPELKTWNLQKDIGMSCGGEVSLLFESFYFSKWSIAIFGAGHISQELCRVMQTWNCQIKVFDTRSEWVSKLPESPNISKKLVPDMPQQIHGLSKNSFILSMTQGHTTDLPILKEALSLDHDFSFVGVIGSKVKALKIRNELSEFGVSYSKISQLRSPLGLPIGNNTPPEIAISIAAQILAHRDGLKINLSN